MSKFAKIVDEAERERALLLEKTREASSRPSAEKTKPEDIYLDPKFTGVKNGKAAVLTENQHQFSKWESRVETVKHAKPDERLVALTYPESMISEQFRMMRTSLKNELAKLHAKVIMVTSSTHSEGKTITATNLAYSLAEDSNIKVALVDADLRRGKVAHYLGFDHREGLSELLEKNLNPRQVMVRNSLPNLFVIPRGHITKKSPELVGSNQFRCLMQELRERFDYVIVDAPPVMSTSDAGIMARDVDGLLFVIQVGRTPKSVIAHAHQLFKQIETKILGYVLTNVEFQTSDYQYYRYGSYDDHEIPHKLRFKMQAAEKMQKVGKGLKDMEDRFNSWWDRRVLKRRPVAVEQKKTPPPAA